MSQTSPIYLAALFVLMSSPGAQADFIYQFTTTTPAGAGGSLSVTITAPDSAVATGTISAADITSLIMQLSGTSLPFQDALTTNTLLLAIPFSVNPSTGDFTSSRPSLGVPPFPEQVILSSSMSDMASYSVSIPDDVTDGAGVWSATAPTPEPSSLVLAGVGGFVALASAIYGRHRRRECASQAA